MTFSTSVGTVPSTLEPVEAAHQHVGDAALHDDAEIGALAGKELVQAMLDDEALGGGLADLDLDLLVRIGRGGCEMRS